MSEVIGKDSCLVKCPTCGKFFHYQEVCMSCHNQFMEDIVDDLQGINNVHNLLGVLPTGEDTSVDTVTPLGESNGSHKS
jgi:hypothetical protein